MYPHSSRPWRPALIVIAAAVTYSNSLSVPFVLDDLASIVDNTHIRHWPTFADLISPLRNTAVAGRPVVELSLGINYALGGLDVRGYHLWNLAVHALCALLLFGIVRRTLELPALSAGFRRRSADIAFAAALIWAVHPLNSEVIDYVVQRTESTMALFYLLAIYAAMRSASVRRPIRWQAVAVGACVIGMLSKESMVTAPLIVVLYDRIFLFESMRQAFAARGRFYLALVSTWVIFAALAVAAPRAEVVGLSSGVSPWTYLMNQTLIIVRYLELAVWPRSLVAFYGWPEPLALATVLPYAAGILALLILTCVGLFKSPKLGFLGAWLFVTLAPASSVVPVSTEVGAERRMYLPLMAIVVLGVVGAIWLWDAMVVRLRLQPSAVRARSAAIASLGLVTIALATATWIRNSEYSSSLSLARTIVERRPTSIAHHILGQELALAGDHDGAIAELRQAIQGDSKARMLLGIELFTRGQWAEAIEQLDAFVRTAGLRYRLVPHWLEPSRAEIIDARTAIGRASAQLGRWPDVIEQSRQILALNPSNADASGMRGDALFAQQKWNEAAAAYRQYLTLRPNDADALTRLGVTLMATDQTADGLAAFRRAVDANPQSGEARRNLAAALLDTNDPAGALVHASAAVALRPRDSVAHELFGRALALQGRLGEGAEQLRQALQLDPGNADARAELERLSSSGLSRRPKS
jgi:tetratricopeptide (TPR) repeat protein